jgi:hypothetical protein
MTFMCTKCDLRYVCNFHPDLVVYGMKVKFSEKLGSMKFIQEVVEEKI